MSTFNFTPYKDDRFLPTLSCVNLPNIEAAKAYAARLKEKLSADFVNISKHITQV